MLISSPEYNLYLKRRSPEDIQKNLIIQLIKYVVLINDAHTPLL